MKQMILMALAAVALSAADATGKWTGTLTTTSDDGSEKRGSAYLVLKQDGTKVTGTAGPDASKQHAVEEGKAENGKLTFEVRTEGENMKFTLQQEGDEIKGTVMRESEDETRTAKLVVKREAP
jgi:hypothetical protein